MRRILKSLIKIVGIKLRGDLLYSEFLGFASGICPCLVHIIYYRFMVTYEMSSVKKPQPRKFYAAMANWRFSLNPKV